MQLKPLATLDYAESELVLGLVYAAGTDTKMLEEALVNYVRKFGYRPNVIRLSQHLGQACAHRPFPRP